MTEMRGLDVAQILSACVEMNSSMLRKFASASSG